MRFPGLLTIMLLALSAPAAIAHEFWLSPESYSLSTDDTMEVRMRVGTGMVGLPQPYLPQNIARFQILQGETNRLVLGRMGDNPALNMPAGPDGLAIVVHETQNSRLTYDEFEVFQRFVKHKDFATALADHKARGLPETGFQETYRRYAKSLIAVGSGAGSDSSMGLKIEIIALANPYTDDLSAGLPVQVLLDGAPRIDAQVELFETAPDATVITTLHRTDAAGQVVLPVRPGMEYLVDSVDLRALDNNDVTAGAVWHSDWASLTFHTPD